MLEYLMKPETLVYLAAGAFVLGYLIINQIVLRIMMVIGTGFYIAYYATLADTPLWHAIYTSIAMGTANLIGLTALLARRSKWAIPTAHRDLYPRFDHLPPGDFRALMRHANRYVCDDKEVLGTEGQPAKRLTYIITGCAHVTKLGETFHIPPGLFVGEVGYLLGRPSAATTILPPGSELITWDTATLDRLSKRPRFKLTLEAAISRDMAAKVAMAVAPKRQSRSSFDTSQTAP